MINIEKLNKHENFTSYNCLKMLLSLSLIKVLSSKTKSKVKMSVKSLRLYIKALNY